MALLDELIADAKLVAAYGQRSGRLRDNELISAIAAIDKIPSPSWNEPTAVALQSALDRAINNISPTTLGDLKDKNWDPFAPSAARGTQRRQIAFVVFSLLLMFITGYSTLVYNRGSSVVSAIEQLMSDQPRSAVNTIVRQLATSVATPQTVASTTGDTTTTATVPGESYFTLIEDLHAYDERFNTYRQQASGFLAENPLPHELPSRLLWPASDYSGPAYDLCKDVAATAPTIKASLTGATLPDILKQMRFFQYQVFCAEGIKTGDFGASDYMGFTYAMRWWISAWGLLYLPALYGAFGATIYYMRRILDPTLPDPTLMHFIHRVALGAFAGVIVTWFWAPNDALATSFTSVGLTLFTVAFIVGFSVDILFALLERFVSAALGVVKGADRRTMLAAPIYVSSERPAVIAGAAAAGAAAGAAAVGAAQAAQQDQGPGEPAP
jgi:hypothetical protein